MIRSSPQAGLITAVSLTWGGGSVCSLAWIAEVSKGVAVAKDQSQIAPLGSKRFGYGKAEDLKLLAPKSFRKAQKAIVAAKKYVKGSGWFSSEKSRLRKLQAEVYALDLSLEKEGYGDRSMLPQARVFQFLNDFASIFPNWQKEYEALNKHIPMFY